MSINPLQLPTWAPAPQVDWSPLSKLGDYYAQQRQQQEAAKIALSMVPGAGPMPEQQGLLSKLGSALGFGGAPAATPPATAPVGAATPTVPAAQGGGGYLTKTAQVESGGNPSAKNPNSSASGLYQFTDGTWLENFDKTFPGMANQSKEWKLTAKNNPQVQQKVMQTFTTGNEEALKAAGVPVDDMSRYAAHFFGAGDATKVLQSADSVPLENVVSPASLQANPFLQGKTVGEARQWLNSKMAGSKPAPGGPGEGLTLLPGQNVPGMPDNIKQALPRMLANPLTQQQGMAMIAKYANPEAELMYRDSQGNMYTRNSATGATKLIDKSELKTPQEFQQKMDLARASSPQVTVNNGGEKAFDQEVSKEYGKTFIEMQKANRDAGNSIATLRTMDRLLEDPNFYSGTGGETVTKFKRGLASLGIKDADTAAPNELFQKLSNKVILDSAGGSLGTGFSNADRDFLQRTTANIENSKEGNRQIIQMAIKVKEREQQISKLARDYYNSHGKRLDAGFDDQLSQWAEKNPLFPQAKAAEPAAAPTTGAPAAPAAPTTAAVKPDEGWTDLGGGIRMRQVR